VIRVDPSQPLANEKHERFAQLLAAGVTMYQAFTEAGFHGDRGNASRTAKREDVSARAAYLRANRKEEEPVIRPRREIAVIGEPPPRAQPIEGEVMAPVTRQRILDLLMENVEIAMGKRPITVVQLVKAKRKTEGGGFEESITAVRVEVTRYDGGAANRALELVGKALGEPFDGSAPVDVGRQRDALGAVPDDEYLEMAQMMLLQKRKQRPDGAAR
jgi:hypothetical protein